MRASCACMNTRHNPGSWAQNIPSFGPICSTKAVPSMRHGSALSKGTEAESKGRRHAVGLVAKKPTIRTLTNQQQHQIGQETACMLPTAGMQVPMVIRGPGGVGRQLGAEHSQRLESYFQSIPGVQLVACSTATNAKALLKSAIRSDNPVIFFEHVLLYNVKGEHQVVTWCCFGAAFRCSILMSLPLLCTVVGQVRSVSVLCD